MHVVPPHSSRIRTPIQVPIYSIRTGRQHSLSLSHTMHGTHEITSAAGFRIHHAHAACRLCQSSHTGLFAIRSVLDGTTRAPQTIRTVCTIAWYISHTHRIQRKFKHTCSGARCRAALINTLLGCRPAHQSPHGPACFSQPLTLSSGYVYS